jgi:DNA polymerase/3'-5' exonuclease PolX
MVDMSELRKAVGLEQKTERLVDMQSLGPNSFQTLYVMLTFQLFTFIGLAYAYIEV